MSYNHHAECKSSKQKNEPLKSDWECYYEWVNFKEPLAELELKEGMKALDVGCGYGQAVRYLGAKGVTAIGLDISPLSGCDVVGDGESLPFKDNSFELVLCANLLHSVPDDAKVLSEIKRVLKPAGKLILISTNKYSLTLCGIRYRFGCLDSKWFDVPLPWRRNFSKKSLKKMLEKLKITVLKIYTAKYVPTIFSKFKNPLTDRLIAVSKSIESHFRAIPLLRNFGECIVVIGEKKE